jgi:hypothetical protein
MRLTDDEALQLWLGAFRYYLGRQTYAVSDFCDALIRNWGDLPQHTRQLIEKELEHAFRQDDQARLDGLQYRALGWDCDRESWARVRALWSKT